LEFDFGYNTRQELDFVLALGTHCYAGSSIPRLKLLRLYHAAAKARSDWGAIDREAVMLCVEEELLIEERRYREVLETVIVRKDN